MSTRDTRASVLERSLAQLLAALARHETFDPRFLRDFMAPVHKETVRIGIRCDISIDPELSLPLLRLATRHALPVTAFCDMRAEYFHRHDWIDALAVAGPELGLKVIPWLAKDANPAAAVGNVARAVSHMRDMEADLTGVAFDPPPPGIQAEAREIFSGWSIGGRGSAGNIPLQTLDMAALGIRYTTMFGTPREAQPAEIASYFGLMQNSGIAMPTLRHAYWVNNPLWDWQQTTVITFSAPDTWLCYWGNSSHLPDDYRRIDDLIDWITVNGKGHRFLFVFDPLLLSDGVSNER